jgi:putative DNA primase/helicase
VKDNEELRGVLNSGHTKVAANVIRNVEINGEHKPRRFSTWAAKAIATIRSLADTLEDRSVIITLQRKLRNANVERLRRRDTEEFQKLRSQAARWAADNFCKLVDPNPVVPEVLNDRASDNWRPLLAIADLAGGAWPEDARRAACLLSGEEQDGAVNMSFCGISGSHSAMSRTSGPPTSWRSSPPTRSAPGPSGSTAVPCRRSSLPGS